MKHPIPIALIDLNDKSRLATEKILKGIEGAKFQTEGKDLGKALSLIRKSKPSIVILNLYPDADKAFNTAKKIIQSFPKIILFVTAQEAASEVILQSMRIGAREFLTQPINKNELTAAVEKVTNTQQDRPSEKISTSKVISVFGTKGGVGTTMVATNVATALAKHTRKDVVIVDLNLQFGTAALQLNIKPKYSILDVANHLDRIDATLLKQKLPKGPNCVSLLASPSKIEDVESITNNHIEQIILLLRTLFDYIIIDTHSVFDDITIKALDESDHVLMVSTSDVPAIFHAKRCLALFQKMGYDKEKLLFVINRYNAADEMDPAAMEKLLDYSVFWRLPNHDLQAILSSINKGIPISKMQPNAKLSKSLQKMILHFNGKVSSPSAIEKRHYPRRKLFYK